MHLQSIADTSIKRAISLQSSPTLKCCIYTCLIYISMQWTYAFLLCGAETQVDNGALPTMQMIVKTTSITESTRMNCVKQVRLLYNFYYALNKGDHTKYCIERNPNDRILCEVLWNCSSSVYCSIQNSITHLRIISLKPFWCSTHFREGSSHQTQYTDWLIHKRSHYSF